jgi:uncharacterized membrane protein
MKSITQELSTNRIEAFSDGVLAIVITLMVLEIKLPELSHHVTDQQAMEALIPLVPKLLAYALSFLMIAIFWVNHHQLFHSVRAVTRGLLWLNNLWLFCICLLPFPTAFLGEHSSLSFASILFGVEMFFCSFSFFIMRYYCLTHLLFDTHLAEQEITQLLRKSATAPILYLLATLLSIVSVYVAYAIFILVPVMFIVSSYNFSKK